MGLSPDHIVVTTGSQQSLYLIGDMLIDPGDIVIAATRAISSTRAPSPRWARQVLAVPMDEDGMDVEAVAGCSAGLESEGRLDRVKFIYCTSYFDNPTGLTLSSARRPRLLEIVRSFSRSASHSDSGRCRVSRAAI